MNHNNVISLPVKPGATLKAGLAVKVTATTGTCELGGAGDSIGIVLHDVSEPASGSPSLPAAIQLFASGGIFNVTASAATTVGQIINLGASGKLHTSTAAAAAGTPRFVCLEVATADGDVIQAIHFA